MAQIITNKTIFGSFSLFSKIFFFLADVPNPKPGRKIKPVLKRALSEPLANKENKFTKKTKSLKVASTGNGSTSTKTGIFQKKQRSQSIATMPTPKPDSEIIKEESSLENVVENVVESHVENVDAPPTFKATPKKFFRSQASAGGKGGEGSRVKLTLQKMIWGRKQRSYTLNDA